MQTSPVIAAFHRDPLPDPAFLGVGCRASPRRESKFDGKSQDGQQKCRTPKGRTSQHTNPNENARSKPSFTSLSVYQPTNSMAQDHDVPSAPGNFRDINTAAFELPAVIWKEWDVIPD